ncbi:MAG: hypothetical protein AAFX85_06395 [Pseudomonadota bacterium]
MLNPNSATCALLAAIVAVGAYDFIRHKADESNAEVVVASSTPLEAAATTAHDELLIPLDDVARELTAFVDHWEP